jgi:hypothetical protein
VRPIEPVCLAAVINSPSGCENEIAESRQFFRVEDENPMINMSALADFPK